MEPIERLQILEDISSLKARYLRCLDTKSWEEFETCFACDVVADMREASGTYDESALIKGAHNYVLSVQRAVESMITAHQCFMREIEILSPISAHGLWAMEDRLWKPPGSSSTLPFNRLNGFGHYHETYEQQDGKWLIKRIQLTRLHVEVD